MELPRALVPKLHLDPQQLEDPLLNPMFQGVLAEVEAIPDLMQRKSLWIKLARLEKDLKRSRLNFWDRLPSLLLNN